MTSALVVRYDDRIAGVLSGYDRVVVTGTLPTICYAAGMTGFLRANHGRIFDYPEFASTLRDQVRERAASLASEAGIAIEPNGKSHIRKEAMVAKVLEQRGDHPGLTSRRKRPISGLTAASACTIISTSWMPRLAWSICGCPPDRRSACNSTATATAGWPGN
jgi:hypothetical protein